MQQFTLESYPSMADVSTSGLIFVVHKTPKFARYIKLEILKLIRQGTSSPTLLGKFRAAVKTFKKPMKILGCDGLNLLQIIFHFCF